MNWYERTVKISKESDIPSDACLLLIADFEGFKSEAYRDPVGIVTIGFGFTKGVQMGDVMSYEDALERLRSEAEGHWDGIKDSITKPLTQSMCDALTSFTYNVGVGAFNSSTLLRRLNRSDYKGAADELLRWDKAGGRVLRGLTRRRKAERELFLSCSLSTQ